MSAPIVASAGAAAGTHAATIAAKPCGRRDAGSAISRTAKSLPSAAKYIFAPLRRRRERKHEAANNVSSSTAAGATCIPGVCITMSGLNSRDNRTNAGAAQPERAPDFRQDQQDQPVEVLQPCTAPQIIPSAKTWDDDSLQSPAHLHGAAMWSDCQAGGGSDGSIGSYIKTPLVADSVPVAVAAAILYPDRPASTGDCGGGGGSGGDGNGDFCTSPAACHSARTSGGGGADRLLRTALHQETCWHELVASVMTDPVTGKDVIILLQTDVTAKVEAERHIALVTQAEHRLLEQIFPRHVLAYMTEEDNSLRACPNSAMGTINLLPAGGSRKSMAAPARDINKLATYHPQVTLLFADIQGFTPMCKVLEPRVVMAFLNDLFTMFDRRLDEFGVYKVETIGDCYFVAGGLIHEDEYGMPAVRARESHADPLHAEKVLMFGKAMLSMAACMSLPTTGGPVKMRIGIHSGPVVSGVVGERMPRFCLFGDTVNTASRMESTGVPGCIHASEAARALLRNEVWVPTGGIEIKGKGLMNTFLWAPPESDSHQALLLFRDLAASHLTLASASSRGGSGWCMECAGPRGRRRNHHRQNQNQNQQQYSRYDAASCAGASASTMQDAITDSTEALKSEAVVDGNVGSGGGNVGSGDGNVGSWGVRCFRCASSRQQQQQQQQQWLLQQMNPRGSAADGTSTSSNSWPEQLYASLAGCSLAGDDDSNLLSLVQLLMPK
ncbi:hypothetical protein Vafri_8910 [Volvox africanus]|uniref:Guanylate cyclase domain-containing protein n=1 Tax=Volvox africanus TaxID=51714 RepID=A0A8J4B413_9CHLO|nr:hypothetical protein Vafri_8910 [Volvox africanus]